MMTEMEKEQQAVYREMIHPTDPSFQSLDLAFESVNASVNECTEELNELLGKVDNRMTTIKISQKLIAIVLGVLLFETSLIYVLFQLLLN